MIPLEDPVVREVTLVLREWGGIWKRLYVVSEPTTLYATMTPFHLLVLAYFSRQRGQMARRWKWFLRQSRLAPRHVYFRVMKIAAKGRKGTKGKEWERRRRDSFEFLTIDKARCSIDNGIARIFCYGAKNHATKVESIRKKCYRRLV